MEDFGNREEVGFPEEVSTFFGVEMSWISGVSGGMRSSNFLDKFRGSWGAFDLVIVIRFLNWG